MNPNMLRFHIPLIEPDMRCKRIRLSDRTSCFRPRKVLRKHRQSDESQLLVEILIRVVREAPAGLFMLLAEPPAKPVGGVPVDESVCRCNRTKVEVIGPPSKFLIQTLNHFPAIHPSHVSAFLDTHRFPHAPNTLPRWTIGYIRPPGFGRITPTKGVPQEIEFTILPAPDPRLSFFYRSLK